MGLQVGPPSFVGNLIPTGAALRGQVNAFTQANTFTVPLDSTVPITISAHSGTQSADLLLITDASLNPLFEVGPKGAITSNSTRTDRSSWLLNVPAALDGNNGVAGLLVSNAGTSNGIKCLRLDNSGTGVNSGGNAAYGLEVRNLLGASGQAIAIHNYAANVGSSVVVDETKNNAMLQLRNAQNSTSAPGDHGTGAFFDLRGYWLTSASANYFTASDGVVTGTNLQSSSATFVAEDAGIVGKQIIVAGSAFTISAFVDAHNVTLNSAPGDGSGITFSYAKLPDQMLTLDASLHWTNLSSQPMIFTNSAGQAEVIKVTQLAAATLPALSIVNPSTGAGINVAQSGAGKGLNIAQTGAAIGAQIVQTGAQAALSITMNSGATGFYGAVVNGYTHGLQATNSQNSGFALQVSKNGTGAGVAASIINKGTGDTTQWFIGSAGTTQAMKLTGLGSLVVGQGAALATTATDGFVYVPSCAGAPTGVPTAQTGSLASVYDTTNNKLWVYNGAWKGVVLA